MPVVSVWGSSRPAACLIGGGAIGLAADVPAVLQGNGSDNLTVTSKETFRSMAQVAAGNTDPAGTLFRSAVGYGRAACLPAAP